jgi:hypothetical protein
MHAAASGQLSGMGFCDTVCLIGLEEGVLNMYALLEADQAWCLTRATCVCSLLLQHA